MATARPDHKLYVRIFGVTSSLSLTVLLIAAFYIQPLQGELTRLGSYAERDFGWNTPQKKIRGDANVAKAYDGKSDVLIVGDSFSTNGVWQPFFRQKTGFSYITLNVRKTSFHDLLQSEQFRKHPPKVVIVQNVERDLIFFYKDLNFHCDAKQQYDINITVQGFGEDPHVGYYEETRKTVDLRNINLRYAASVMLNSVIRSISGRDSKNTKRFVLTKSTLFSNLRSGEILIYEGDMDKLSWREEELAKAVCSIRGLQDLVQSNGKTLFIFLLAPDKSTAYSGYITTPVFRSVRNTHQWLLDYGINAPRIDLMIRKAIDREEKDIYSPSGTHWSARGYELVAEGTADFIRKHVMLYP